MGSCFTKGAEKEDRLVESKSPEPKKGGRKFKILLLGAGESGKSTMAKQMKIAFMDGFTDSEKNGYCRLIHKNVLENMRNLIKGAQTFGIHLDEQIAADRVMSPSFMPDGVLIPEAAADLKRLWLQDNGIRQVMDRGTEVHFFDNLDRLSDPHYVPSYDDILRSRRLTVGAEELDFSVDGNMYHVIDVGGQKGEREKWIDYFQNNDAVIFFVALSEYDQKLLEDNTTNRLAESLKLFSDVSNHQWFAESAIIIFLNKRDLFRQKLQKVPLSQMLTDYRGDILLVFPLYKAGPNELEPAAKFIQQKFLDRVTNKRKQIYPFVTEAVNTQNFQGLFRSVQDVLLSPTPGPM